MEKMFNEVSLLDEESVDSVVTERNLARTKGFLVGASVVGAGWLATYLYKKLKKQKAIEIESEVVKESEQGT